MIIAWGLFQWNDGQKTLISAERIKQTTPLITEKKPNLVFGLGTDQTPQFFMPTFCLVTFDATTLYTKDSKEEKPRKKIS